MQTFGRHLRSHWHLDDEGTFLNHGSFGACPKDVLAEQSRWRLLMERQPDSFFRYTVSPRLMNNELRVAAERLGRFVGTECERIAFVTNATEAVNTVLRSLRLKAGDEILVLDCVYNAVRLASEEVCKASGAKVVKVSLPIPLTANDVAERIADAAGAKTRLAIIDHIASPTAVVFPVAEITRALKAKGVRVLIDGAHAVGQLALDLPAIGADWYTANCHKWLYSPRGSAFLYATEEVAGQTVPLSVSHWHELKFPRAFDYVGTRDVSAFLSVPAAIDFIERFDTAKVRDYLMQLSREGVALMARLGAEPTAPDAMFAAMCTYTLPQRREAVPDDALQLMQGLWEKHKVQIASNAFQGKLLCRLSAQIYVERADVEHGVAALERHGWPGR
ncbi:MAG: aminotransferase class V-fold PLP-dependent enzyme [Alphaproteobacteria bacterium]|nr:aminotransferase class V-fold PLP-dependent enzyme [Alphaproteobacteria bacterium]